MSINAKPAVQFLKLSPMSALRVILSPVNHAAALSWINCCQQRLYLPSQRGLPEKPAAAGMKSAAARRTAKAAAHGNNKVRRN
jgi:hypothetical protein